MKPLHGISFDVGTERGVGDFTAEYGDRKFVVTMAKSPDNALKSGLIFKRFEARVAAEKSIRFTSDQAKALEFSCLVGATAMPVTGLAELATGSLD